MAGANPASGAPARDPDRRRHRPDRLLLARFWPESVVKPHPVSEFDGNAKYHRESYGRATEETILKERGRERALWRLGYPMARWTWGDAWYDNGARMLAELATVGVRPGAVRW